MVVGPLVVKGEKKKLFFALRWIPGWAWLFALTAVWQAHRFCSPLATCCWGPRF